MPNRKTTILAVAFVLSLIFSAQAAEPKRKLHGHVPSVVAHLTSEGLLPGTNTISLAIGLPLSDAAGLDRFLAQVYDPASPVFRHYLSPEEFTARFGPTEQDYEAVKNFARTNGLTITATHGNRLLLDVRGSAAAVEQAFHVTLRTYQHPTEAREFFAPDTEPLVDASLPIADVSGLDSYTRPFPKVHHSPAMVAPNSGSAPDGFSYIGSDFRDAYVPGTTLDGSGQMVGLVQFEGFFASDIAAYAGLAGGGRTNITVQTVLLDDFTGTPNTSDPNGIAEASLDIEMSMAMAPGLSQIMVFEGNQNNFIPNDVLNAMAASNMVKNLSSSWGWTGGPTATTDNIFKTMAAQGQSYFNASGDSDAFPAGFVDSPGETTTPSSSPFVTEVGGTTLSTTGPGGAYTSETVWNWGYVPQAGKYLGASGGVSSFYSIPTWQQGINSFLVNGGSPGARNIPDVSLTADDVYVLYDLTSGEFGGTSCAAPLWAGFLALVNQQAALSGKPPVGFINPAVYELANESIYSSAFHDITTGNNTWPSSPNAFYAVPGYDLCTGVGTPAGTNLINALINPDPLVVVPNGGFTTLGSALGNFTISAQTFYLTNAGSISLDWSLINTSLWLDASASGGTLAAGASNAVVVSLNNVASNLTAGVYSANLWFTNITSGVGHSRFFILQVPDSIQILPTNNFSFIGLVGGPFGPAAGMITLTNIRPGTVSWSINNTSSWFNVSAVSGSLISGAQTNVTLTLVPADTNLPAGTYSATFLVTNITGQTVQAITANLVVLSALVQNGGFETGDLTGWGFSGTIGDDVVGDSSSIAGLSPHSGTYFGAFGEPGTEAYFFQTLPTISGQKYLLSLWLNSSANPQGSRRTTPNEFSVSWNGTNVFDKVNVGRVGWTNLQFVVTAGSANTTLQIGGRDDNYFLGLDDILLIPGVAPSISLQPTNLVVLSGSSAVFSVAASGTTNLSYLWTKNGTNLANGTGISGATSATLVLTAVTTNSTANYAVTVTNFFGSTNSSVATLTVLVPPFALSSSLTNRSVQCGSNNLTFAITAGGTAPLSYQWSLDGTPVSNATNITFSLTNLHLPSHTLSVLITNLYGSLASNAVLTVQDTIGPAITLNGNNPVILELGSTFTEPGATATDTCAGVVGVSIGGSVNTNSVGTNTIIYSAGDGNGNTNTITRTVIVRDTTPPTILWSFTNLVLAANSNCVAAMPDLTGTNYVMATDLSGPVINTQMPTNNSVLMAGSNTVIITVVDGSGNASYSTNMIVVKDLTPPIITLSGSNPMFSELGQMFVEPGVTANDNCAGVLPVTTSGLVNTSALSTNILIYTAGDPAGNTNTVARIVIVHDTTPPTVLWSFTNLVLAANSNCAAVMPDVTGTNYILASDLSGVAVVSQSPTNDSILSIGSNVVVIAVSDTFSNIAYSTNFIVVQDQIAPMILAQPESRTNNAGSTASFTVAASACTPTTFQWFFNQVSLDAQTNSTLTLSNLSLTAAGNYAVIVTASGGSVTSTVAVLTVYVPPGISGVVANLDGSFTLNLIGSPGNSYILESATNLSLPIGWLFLATNTLGTNGVWQFTDSQATNFPQQFYRLMLAP